MAARQKPEAKGAKERRRAIGQRVHDVRSDQGLTQDQLAEAADLSEGTVRAVESGRRGPSVDSISAIAAALGVPVAAFFTEAKSSASTPESVATALVRELDPRVQPVVVRFLRELNRVLRSPSKPKKTTRTKG